MTDEKGVGSGRFVAVPEWASMQHYKDRNPPWIKLHNELLETYEFEALPDAMKWHVVGIRLLASRLDNRIPADAEFIRRRIGALEPVDLDALLSAGFLTYLDDRASTPPAPRKRSASKARAPRKQNAITEGEGEGEREGEKRERTDTFVEGDASVANGRTANGRTAGDEAKLAEYIGSDAAAGRLAERVGGTSATAVLAMFGPNGTDPMVWRNPETGEALPAEGRPAMLGLAVDRYALESGGKWDSRLFRRYLETVIRSTLEGERGSNGTGTRRGSGKRSIDDKYEGLPEHLR